METPLLFGGFLLLDEVVKTVADSAPECIKILNMLDKRFHGRCCLARGGLLQKAKYVMIITNAFKIKRSEFGAWVVAQLLRDPLLDFLTFS